MKELIAVLDDDVADHDAVIIMPRRCSELIRCKDCKYFRKVSYGRNEWRICDKTKLGTNGHEYCSWAEKRSDTEAVSKEVEG